MSVPKVHRRQFVIGPERLLAQPDWRSETLDGGLVLSHCSELRIQRGRDRNGVDWWLLGTAIQTVGDRVDPIPEIGQSVTGDVIARTDSWTGRWVLIGQDHLYLDACGLLGCYYRSGVENRSLWVSSSPGVILEIPRLPKPKRSARKIVHGVGLDYDLPPRTLYDGVKKLLPSQVLCLKSGAVRGRRLVHVASESEAYPEVLDELEQYFTTTLKNIEKSLSPSGRLWIALSGGYDSRLLFAAAKAAGLRFQTYTQEVPGRATWDYEIAKQLAQMSGVEHRYIRREAVDPDRRRAFDAHVAGLLVDVEREFHSRKQWSWPDRNDVLVRGFVFEAGRCFFWNRFSGNWDPANPATADLVAYFSDERRSREARKSLGALFDWFARHPQDHIDWRDRFYIESRLGGWASQVEQSLDLTNASSINPANSRRFLSLVLSIPWEKRMATAHQVDLIRRYAPELCDLPFKPATKLLNRFLGRVKAFAQVIRYAGPLALYDKVARRLSSARLL